MNQHLRDLLAEIPEQYQDIYGHPEYSGNHSRDCLKREKLIRQIIHEIQGKTGKKELKVLDLGCAQGYYSFVAAEMGCDVFGIDMLDINVNVCNALRNETDMNCAFRQQTVQKTVESLQDGEYDIVFLFSVIHHISNENGFSYARKMLELLSKKASCVLAEMALKEEPLYWNENLPCKYEEWFANIPFFNELDFFETHLSEIKRPLIFASNKWCEADGTIYEIETYKNNSYPGQPLNPGRNYYFCENGKYLIKLYRNVEEALFSEIRNEKEMLQNLSHLDFAPRLVCFSENDHRIMEVTEIQYGTLLWEHLKKGEILDYETIFMDLLDNLIALEKLGYYHGDLRTWNVCLSEDKHAFLIDFGAIISSDEDTVAEKQYGFNGVRISTKRAFISLVYDCMTGNTYPSIGKYGAYDLSLYYDFDKIPEQYSFFIANYLIAENKIKTFDDIKKLLQESITERNRNKFSVEELYQIQANQNRAVYYEKASFNSSASRESFNLAQTHIALLESDNAESKACIGLLENRIMELESRIAEMESRSTIIAEWANTALTEIRTGCRKL